MHSGNKIFYSCFCPKISWRVVLGNGPDSGAVKHTVADISYQRKEKSSPLLPEAKLSYYEVDSLQTVILTRRKLPEEMTA